MSLFKKKDSSIYYHILTSLAGEMLIDDDVLKSINLSSINKHNPVQIISSTKYWGRDRGREEE